MGSRATKPLISRPPFWWWKSKEICGRRGKSVRICRRTPDVIVRRGHYSLQYVCNEHVRFDDIVLKDV